MIYLELFLTFFKIGAFTFGGGYAMLPLIQAEVQAHQWMTNKELVNFVAVSESTPGPFAVNVSTYVGIETAGILGAFSATLGVVLPSFIIILIVAKCFAKFQKSILVKGCMSGLKPAVVGLIGASIIAVGKTVFFIGTVTPDAVLSYHFVTSAIIFVVMLVLVFQKKHPIFIIGLSACLGILVGYIQDIIS